MHASHLVCARVDAFDASNMHAVRAIEHNCCVYNWFFLEAAPITYESRHSHNESRHTYPTLVTYTFTRPLQIYYEYKDTKPHYLGSWRLLPLQP
jgi:hypothetical protein